MIIIKPSEPWTEDVENLYRKCWLSFCFNIEIIRVVNHDISLKLQVGQQNILHHFGKTEMSGFLLKIQYGVEKDH